jgi:hypothetical protein
MQMPSGETASGRREVGVSNAGHGNIGVLLEEADDLSGNHVCVVRRAARISSGRAMRHAARPFARPGRKQERQYIASVA